MLFNSFEFALFFPVVTLFYFALRGVWRIYWLLAASFLFYAAFIPSYTLILMVVILIDYSAGLLMERTGSALGRRFFLAVSLAGNLGILCTFKYFNFISQNLASAFHYQPWLLAWVLPIGLSFHTFQSMAYTIEVYKRRYPAERSLPHLALYVMFYPQLVAGPIERPFNLLRQLHVEHRFSYDGFRSGLRLMLWGLFKKAAIADRLSFISDAVFTSHAAAPLAWRGPVVAVGALAFAVQIYCDFSGYSDIAIGAARVMGFKLATNFRRPYFATTFQEFWRRWHISLSSWFRDYVYIPLGGGKHGRLRMFFALVAVFLLSGLWHGANWTFLAWGALHAVFRVGEWALSRFAHSPGRVSQFARGLLVFVLVTYAWIFFRAPTISAAWSMTQSLGQGWASLVHPIVLLRQIAPRFGGEWNFLYAGLGVLILLLVDWGLESGWLRPWFDSRPAWQRMIAYNCSVLGLYALWAKDQQQFIYFQF